ncbi:hypothetical protein SKAU_G00080150 [Synaphobranchus kaupii]|uniref:Uncharacterized protein n=1 Tax=Synaphobranchus kaupii TaxID=118154 RepID=A0A9Q1FUY2_SYNKA|nr:hypothetical protein SKAU_G00080150 [Synaphobranchus kaupii]
MQSVCISPLPFQLCYALPPYTSINSPPPPAEQVRSSLQKEHYRGKTVRRSKTCLRKRGAFFALSRRLNFGTRAPGQPSVRSLHRGPDGTEHTGAKRGKERPTEQLNRFRRRRLTGNERTRRQGRGEHRD